MVDCHSVAWGRLGSIGGTPTSAAGTVAISRANSRIRLRKAAYVRLLPCNEDGKLFYRSERREGGEIAFTRIVTNRRTNLNRAISAYFGLFRLNAKKSFCSGKRIGNEDGMNLTTMIARNAPRCGRSIGTSHPTLRNLPGCDG